jgi:alpha-D-ribose 1-methylphosphonate 5-triphosphate synthase subunit PhnG
MLTDTGDKTLKASNDDARSRRQAWLATLAHAPRGELMQAAARFTGGLAFETLREPESGLAMLRARIDARGDRFNLGEATLTRCVVRLRCAEAVTVGVGYCLGRDGERARRMAELDALLQQPSRQADLLRAVIEPLRRGIEASRLAQRRRAAASRVNFRTLATEDAS